MPIDAMARMYRTETGKSVSCSGVSTPKMLTIGPSGITANAVAPGWIATSSQTPEEVEQGLATPIGRSGRPEEIAEVVAFLASERAGYLTGQSLVVDGGNTIQEIKG